MSRQQYTLMKFDPASGEERPYPSHAEQWRSYHGDTAWLFNPWSGTRRDARDIGRDTFGHLLMPPGEPLFACADRLATNREMRAKQLEAADQEVKARRQGGVSD